MEQVNTKKNGKSINKPSFWNRFLPAFWGGAEFRLSPENPSTSFTSWLSALLGPRSTAGVPINQQNVIGLTAVWRAINILAESIGSIPFEIIEEQDNGIVRVAKDHPIYNLINREPNQLYTSYTFRHTLMVHVLVYGNAYAIIERDTRTTGTARPKKLTIVNDPRRMEAFLDAEGNLFYKLDKAIPEGANKIYRADEVIHLQNLSFNGLAGVNMLDIHRDNYGLGLANRNYINAYYKNGTLIGGWIEFPDVLEDTQYKRMKTSFKLEYGGSENAGSTPILEGGAKYHQLNANLGDAKSLETQKFSIDDVSRIFGVPAHMLSELDRSTNNNIEKQSLEFVIYTLRPWIKRWEQEFNRKLFMEKEKSRFYTRLNMNAYLRGDTESRASFYREAIQNGWMSINEVRAHEKLNPIEGGDVHLTQLNMTTIDKIGQEINNTEPNNNENGDQ